MKILRVSGWVMLGAGGLVLAFLAYQLFGTDVLAARSQAQAEEDLSFRFEQVRDTLPVPTATAPSITVPSSAVTTGPVSLYQEPAAPEGEPFGRLVIDKLGVDEVIFEGVDRTTLKKGPGHMPWTPLPGQPGNAVLSGHRTTYGRPFYDLDALGEGDQIMVETVLGRHVYVVRESIIVVPTDVWVTEVRPGAWLTLTTCHPRFSAKQRLVVFAELTAGPNLAYVEALDTVAGEEAA